MRAPALRTLWFHYSHTSAGLFRGLTEDPSLKLLRRVREHAFSGLDEMPYETELPGPQALDASLKAQLLARFRKVS